MPYNHDTGLLEPIRNEGRVFLQDPVLPEGDSVQLTFSTDGRWESEGSWNHIQAEDWYPCDWYWHFDHAARYRVRDVRHQCGLGFPERVMDEGAEHCRITATPKFVCYYCDLCRTAFQVSAPFREGEGEQAPCL